MEPLTQMMTQFIEMQQKTQNFWQDAFKSSNKLAEDYSSIVDNSIKFHQAAIEYHTSVIKMMEAIKDTQEILTKSKK
jgi:hypothetical protein